MDDHDAMQEAINWFDEYVKSGRHREDDEVWDDDGHGRYPAWYLHFQERLAEQ